MRGQKSEFVKGRKQDGFRLFPSTEDSVCTDSPQCKINYLPAWEDSILHGIGNWKEIYKILWCSTQNSYLQIFDRDSLHMSFT